MDIFGPPLRWIASKTYDVILHKIAQQGSIKYSKILRETVCDHQILYTAYSLEMGKTHQELDHLLSEVKKKEREVVTRTDSEKIYDKLSALRDCHFLNLEGGSKLTCDFYVEYFSTSPAKKGTDSRACIKLTSENEIIDHYRSSGNSYSPYPSKDNTGFVFSSYRGKEYACQDIPAAVKAGNYENSRISVDSVKAAYKKPFPYCVDTWPTFWKRPEDGKPFSDGDCYKSTLIVPMTIGSADKTKKNIRELVDRLSSATGNEKCVLGFVCIDSPKAHTINDLDISTGWMMADLMSLYLIDYLIYWDHSDIVEEAIEMLLAKDRSLLDEHQY